MVELNVEHGAGITAAGDRFVELFRKVVPPEQLAINPPVPLTKTYMRCWMSVHQMARSCPGGSGELR